MEPGKKIVLYPHPALRHPAKPLSAIDAEVRRYAGRMLELMYTNKGLGLAGPAGRLAGATARHELRGRGRTRRTWKCVAVNPVIMDRKGTQEGDEGCLSFPDLYQKVRRAKTVTVQYYDLDGNLCEMTAHDLPARLWQHEIDHLHGRLFIDMMGPIGRMSSKSTLRGFEAELQGGPEEGRDRVRRRDSAAVEGVGEEW